MTKKEQLKWNKKPKSNRLSTQELNNYRSFLALEYPICQICKEAPTQEFHHLFFGRYGGDKDDRTLIATCRKCHEWCHANKHESQRKYKNIVDNNWSKYEAIRA